jgi:hypothetical protein
MSIKKKQKKRGKKLEEGGKKLEGGGKKLGEISEYPYIVSIHSI